MREDKLYQKLYDNYLTPENFIKNKSGENRAFSPLFVLVFDGFPGAKQKGYAPQTGQRDHCVDNTADQGVLTAKNPRNQIKLK